MFTYSMSFRYEKISICFSEHQTGMLWNSYSMVIVYLIYMNDVKSIECTSIWNPPRGMM